MPLPIEPFEDSTVLQFGGISQAVSEWALDYGITPGIIIARLQSGVSVADAITTPMRVGFAGQRLPKFHKQQIGRLKVRPNATKANLHVHDGRSLTLGQWAKAYGMTKGTLRSRLRGGWTLEEALTTPIRPLRKADTGMTAEGAGVSADFAPFEGTGAGSTAQETPNLTFSGNDA
ncbi:hypothetical protein LXM96_19270 [Rhizobium sp. TRM95001]|nr:hypothetical protein [Rhizobium halophilum]MCF6370978.1 hypothetical protein [Rhizobium halophilum]